MSQSTKRATGGWWKKLLLAAIVAAVAFWGGSYLTRPVAQVIAASRTKAVRTVPGTVAVKSEYDIALKSEVGGRVMTSELEVGRRVFKGDVLVTIDPGDVDLEIERISNDLAAAKRKVEIGSTLRAEEANQKDALDVLERQLKAGNLAQIDFEKAKRLYQQVVQRRELDEVNLQSALTTLENNLRAKQREKAKMTIVAPSDAIVTEVFARVGDLIGPNAPIASLISVSRTIEARLSEDNFAAVKVGQRATVRFLTFGNEQYPAKVSKQLPSADPTTQRYGVYLEVELPEGREVMPGLTGEVSIIVAERPNAVTVPRRALVGDYVYVVAGLGRVELRKVEKGYDSLNYVEILKGVEAGEPVIVEQQDRFHAGDRVRTKVLEN
jgi:RND family efflux transporter MFP subunit